MNLGRKQKPTSEIIKLTEVKFAPKKSFRPKAPTVETSRDGSDLIRISLEKLLIFRNKYS